jgi:hypothetical protein
LTQHLNEPAQWHGTEARSNPDPVSLSNLQFQCSSTLLVGFNFHRNQLGFGALSPNNFQAPLQLAQRDPTMLAKLPLR